ncbi:nudC domain-containing protein 3 isoform X2 [Prionailurus viverrinus]|uniref:nudC domain-containing protein 3 isoform X2 n=1 Tax=Prionailurus viverrinus TaxID=61388 RepID=UPI001FF361BA|nr:nudC domain-containing protein 3 isoform X2 [Prionailurus viverrinus]
MSPETQRAGTSVAGMLRVLRTQSRAWMVSFSCEISQQFTECGVCKQNGSGCLMKSLYTSSRRQRRQEQFQRNPDSYNGAVRENYTWSQDYTDLELKVPVPKHVVKGRQVSVALSSSSIRVAVLEEAGEHVLMEGKFTHKVNTESSLWSLEPGKCVLAHVVAALGEHGGAPVRVIPAWRSSLGCDPWSQRLPLARSWVVSEAESSKARIERQVEFPGCCTRGRRAQSDRSLDSEGFIEPLGAAEPQQELQCPVYWNLPWLRPLFRVLAWSVGAAQRDLEWHGVPHQTGRYQVFGQNLRVLKARSSRVPERKERRKQKNVCFGFMKICISAGWVPVGQPVCGDCQGRGVERGLSVLGCWSPLAHGAPPCDEDNGSQSIGPSA